MTTENEQAAAETAAAETSADAVVHPTEPQIPVEPVPDPPHDVAGDPSVEDIEELRRDALEDDEPGELIDVRESALEHLEIPFVNVIPPTVGRKVWFRKAGADLEGQPEDATIVYVHSDHLVNLFVVSPNGEPRGETSIPLVHEGEERPEGGHFAEWMPFQKGQARPPLPVTRFALVGDDVYYGDGTGPMWPAKITGLKEIGIADLTVFERERVVNVFDVAKADLDARAPLNGWVFKA